jgi:hypothetical protein
MAAVTFTQNLRRHVGIADTSAPGATVREVLDAVFAAHPRLRGYVLDDQGHLRANVVCFIDGRRCSERVALNDPLQPTSRVHVLQALSGG